MALERQDTEIKRRKEKLFDNDSSHSSVFAKLPSDSKEVSEKENSLQKGRKAPERKAPGILFDDEMGSGVEGSKLENEKEEESVDQFQISDDMLDQKLKGKPYYEAVQTLKAVVGRASPFEKLLVLLKVRQSIEDNVQTFWEGIQVERENLQLTTDQFIPIYMFVILKAQVQDLVAHVRLVKEFISDHVQFKSALGNTLSLIETALQFIVALDYRRLDEPNYLIDFKASDLFDASMKQTVVHSIRQSSRATMMHLTVPQQAREKRNARVMDSIALAAQSNFDPFEYFEQEQN